MFFLDLSRAFDSLDHTIMLEKICNVGIRGKPFQLFTDYFTNRQQSVFCNNEYSFFGDIKQGTPQGFILGPILFLIYINDIIKAINKCGFVILVIPLC